MHRADHLIHHHQFPHKNHCIRFTFSFYFWTYFSTFAGINTRKLKIRTNFLLFSPFSLNASPCYRFISEKTIFEDVDCGYHSLEARPFRHRRNTYDSLWFTTFSPLLICCTCRMMPFILNHGRNVHSCAKCRPISPISAYRNCHLLAFQRLLQLFLLFLYLLFCTISSSNRTWLSIPALNRSFDLKRKLVFIL